MLCRVRLFALSHPQNCNGPARIVCGDRSVSIHRASVKGTLSPQKPGKYLVKGNSNVNRPEHQPALYTAAQIARATGATRQSVQWLLKPIAPTSSIVVKGQETNIWSLAVLPVRLVAKLEENRTRQGFKEIHDLLSTPARKWEPPIPLSEIRKEFVEKAISLRTALAEPLAQQHNLSSRELMALGVREFSRVFGYPISGKQWRRIFERAVTRDCGNEEFSRVEIYIDDTAFLRRIAATESLKHKSFHRELDEVVLNLEDKRKPTADDRAWLFDAVFAHYERMTIAGDRRDRRTIKASLIEYLFSAVPGLSKSTSALRRVFELKLSEWQSAGRTSTILSDKRHLASGNFRRPEFAEDLKKIKQEAILHGGNESLAHRTLRQKGELSPEFLKYYSFNPRQNKSYVPKTVRGEITPDVDMCGPLHRGPWEAKMRGPYIPRDWSEVGPGDWFSGDDVTWNNYFYFYDDDGQLHIERGECLVMVDLRTGYPLDFVLIAGKYNGRFIRSLLTKVHDKHGLPHKGVYFERGVWASRWVDGSTDRQAMHWRETELGLREKGVDLQCRHATTPRAKPIEGLFRILQERQRSAPGFVGFNERSEKMERMQDFLARARREKEHPGNEMLEMSQWVKKIAEDFWSFANDPQNGKMLEGLSPAEMFEDALNRRPMRKLPEEARYTLATHKKAVTVGQHGIKISIGNKTELYCNEQTGRLIGREVLAFYNIDFPDLLTVSDLQRQNYFSVKRIELPAMTATKEQFAEVRRQINGHMAPAKAIYGSIPHRVVATVVQDNRYDERTKELGRFHNEAVENAQTEKASVETKLRKIQSEVATGTATVRPQIKNEDVVLRGIEEEKPCRERLARKQSKANAHE